MDGARIGFTGTQEGTTPEQNAALIGLYVSLMPIGEFHNGLCVGADFSAWLLIQSMRDIEGWTKPKIIGHPPTNPIKIDRRIVCHEMRNQKPYLDRNQDIVDESDILIATPKEYEEVIRSGTWATIRRGRKKSMKIFIIYPDGTISEEN